VIYVVHLSSCAEVVCFSYIEIMVVMSVCVAVMQPPGTVPIDLNSYRTRKYASMHGRGNRTGL